MPKLTVKMMALVIFRATRAFVTGPKFSLSSRARLESRRWLSSKKRLVFLGSPAPAAKTLDRLLDASNTNDSSFEVVGCVSQPPAAKGRKRLVQPCEVQVLAEERGLTILTPSKAKCPDFLKQLTALEPDLCVTAAFGQFLPSNFLSIPTYGTWNIHPSLLPRYRGAAPLQRSLEAGDSVIGVTVLKTVLKMDAGPIVAQLERHVRNDDDDAQSLLEELFLAGLDLLLSKLPELWAGTITYIEQDEARVSHAPKLDVVEAELDLETPPSDHRTIAKRAADKVRAFSPWPGTWLGIKRPDDEASKLKIVIARPAPDDDQNERPGGRAISLVRGALRIRCADGSLLDVTMVQPPNRKPMDAKAFWCALYSIRCELVNTLRRRNGLRPITSAFSVHNNRSFHAPPQAVLHSNLCPLQSNRHREPTVLVSIILKDSLLTTIRTHMKSLFTTENSAAIQYDALYVAKSPPPLRRRHSRHLISRKPSVECRF